MTIRFRCRCGAVFRVDDAMAGKQARCNSCKARFRVPARQSDRAAKEHRQGALLDELDLSDLPGEPFVRAGVAYEPTAPVVLRRRSRKRRLPLTRIALIAGAALAAVIACSLIWTLVRAVGQWTGKAPILWQVAADPGVAEVGAVPSARALSISRREAERISVVPPDGRFAVLMDSYSEGSFHAFRVWDLFSDREVLQVDGHPGLTSIMAVSPDGRSLVGLALPGTSSELVFCSPSQTSWKVSYQAGRPPVSFCRFLPQGKLLAVGAEGMNLLPREGLNPPGYRQLFVTVHDVRDGRVELEFQAETGDLLSADVSPGGRYLAYRGGRYVFVYHLRTGELVGKLHCSRIGFKERARARHSADEGQVRFSPDGRTLTAWVPEPNEAKILRWDCENGALLHEDLLPLLQGRSSSDFRWLDDECNLGYADGIVFDRRYGRVLWKYDNRGDSEFRPFGAVGERSLAVVYKGEQDVFHVRLLDILGPAKKRMLDEMESDSPAWLRPGDAVGLDIRIGELRVGERAAVERRLRGAFTKALSAVGLSVADAHSVSFQLDYSESPGDLGSFKTMKETQEILEKPLLGRDARDLPRGEIVQMTRVQLRVSLVSQDAAPLWTRELEGVPIGLILDVEVFRKEEANEAGLWKKCFEALLHEISRLRIPYYVGKGPDAAVLPGRTTFRYDKRSRQLVTSDGGSN